MEYLKEPRRSGISGLRGNTRPKDATALSGVEIGHTSSVPYSHGPLLGEYLFSSHRTVVSASQTCSAGQSLRQSKLVALANCCAIRRGIGNL